ncbi:uncharacterized protein Tco025E_03920 [Trypanosoma conorhini]|uniref:Uncharacterized protein n=1 Tax=Trypanosoma conorhini TaxID=83891 RepID=A0A3R7MSX3_9TRYP|nr:uncharacterized protein Tco025E_03920 [Trypanosoma conorhini]RNF20142.1 hypothetical protein Tco025E_03920 [Trypanosoma conorhini]
MWTCRRLPPRPSRESFAAQHVHERRAVEATVAVANRITFERPCRRTSGTRLHPCTDAPAADAAAVGGFPAAHASCETPCKVTLPPAGVAQFFFRFSWCSATAYASVAATE